MSVVSVSTHFNVLPPSCLYLHPSQHAPRDEHAREISSSLRTLTQLLIFCWLEWARWCVCRRRRVSDNTNPTMISWRSIRRLLSGAFRLDSIFRAKRSPTTLVETHAVALCHPAQWRPSRRTVICPSVRLTPACHVTHTVQAESDLIESTHLIEPPCKSSAGGFVTVLGPTSRVHHRADELRYRDHFPSGIRLSRPLSKSASVKLSGSCI